MMDSLDRLRAALADRYTVERELGRGGTATVCLATDLRHDRAVTLKVLNPDLGVVIGPERLLREIQTTARLTHPHILPLLDSGDTDGALFYVMPYPPGKSLRKGSRRRSSQRWTTHSYHAMPVLAKSGVLPWANVWGVSFVGADLYGVTTLGPPLECQSELVLYRAGRWPCAAFVTPPEGRPHRQYGRGERAGVLKRKQIGRGR